MRRIFGDPVVATALLDRLLHHAIVTQIEFASYRLKTHSELIQSSPQNPLLHRRLIKDAADPENSIRRV